MNTVFDWMIRVFVIVSSPLVPRCASSHSGRPIRSRRIRKAKLRGCRETYTCCLDQIAELRKVNSLPLFKECRSYCRASYWLAEEEAYAVLRSRQPTI